MRALWALCVAVTACHSHDHGHDHPGDDAHDHPAREGRPALSFTHWTEQSELFIELPALVRALESPCAAHVTTLQPFAPLVRGSVTAVLRGPSGDERFESAAPSVPGIFRPVIRPTSTGPRRLLVEVRGQGLTADHDLGEVTVYDTEAAAAQAIPEEPEIAGRIGFTKEQQWPIEFDTAIVTTRGIRPSLRAFGTLRPRSDGDIVVVAPAAGRFATRGNAHPKLGDRVSVEDRLGALVPRLDAADVASLELAVTSAELEQRFAERELTRLSELRAQGAVPARRVEDAAHAAAAARAALETARRRLDQFQRVERPGAQGAGSIQLRAPLSGTITAVHVAPGAFVEAGAELFRVTDLTQLWLDVRVPAVDAAAAATSRGATFFAPGAAPLELAADALVARSPIVDPDSRTLSILFAFDNASAKLPAGLHGRVHLAIGEEHRALAVPDSAIVDDGGVFVVYVQVEGESFERRAVRLGARDRGFVEIVTGVQAGEHVVTRGAYSIKLAASSGAVPAHGHAH